MNCLSVNDMNNINLFIYKQWSLLKLQDDMPNNNKKNILKKIEEFQYGLAWLLA